MHKIHVSGASTNAQMSAAQPYPVPGIRKASWQFHCRAVSGRCAFWHRICSFSHGTCKTDAARERRDAGACRPLCAAIFLLNAGCIRREHGKKGGKQADKSGK